MKLFGFFLVLMCTSIVTDNGRTNAQELADSATVVREREDREDNDDEAPVVVCEDTGLEVRENKKEEKAVSIGAPGELDDEILVASSKGGGTKKDRRRRIVGGDMDDDDDDNVVGPIPGPAAAARAKSVGPITAKKAKPVLSFADYDD